MPTTKYFVQYMFNVYLDPDMHKLHSPFRPGTVQHGVLGIILALGDCVPDVPLMVIASLG